MIDLWDGIRKLHFDEYVKDCDEGFGVALIKKNDKLLAKATMICTALRHYQIELETSDV